MTTAMMTRPRLRIVAGVCAGFAEHTGLPVSLVRIATVVLSITGGFGLLFYAWLWATTPSADGPATPAPLKNALTKPSFAASSAESAPFRTAAGYGASAAGYDATARDSSRYGPLRYGTLAAGAAAPSGASASEIASDERGEASTSWERLRAAPVTEILLGLALLGAGITLVLSRLGAAIPIAVVIPAIVIVAGTGLAWSQFDSLRRHQNATTPGLLVRALGALVLVALGILLFFVTGDEPNAWTVIIAALAVLVGVAVVAAPWVVRLARDLADERSARLREADRAEIAAHLHDSVLQTLALIQQKAGPASEVSRLARAQERELRDWLFAGQSETTADFATELRRIAGVIETDYAAHIEVVTTGASPDAVPDAMLAAAREALLNAARHAGGTISVYLESSPKRVELTISDRGPGFSLDDIPDDRMGVRESIIGRMGRGGGEARLRPGPGGTGTQWTLTLPLPDGQTT